MTIEDLFVETIERTKRPQQARLAYAEWLDTQEGRGEDALLQRLFARGADAVFSEHYGVQAGSFARAYGRDRWCSPHAPGHARVLIAWAAFNQREIYAAHAWLCWQRAQRERAS